MVETDWADLWISAADWAEAFEAPDPGTPHNEARDQVREALLSNLLDDHDDEEWICRFELVDSRSRPRVREKAT
jgi:hypothetical protein